MSDFFLEDDVILLLGSMESDGVSLMELFTNVALSICLHLSKEDRGRSSILTTEANNVVVSKNWRCVDLVHPWLSEQTIKRN